jgi:hypothetical protein
MQNYSDIKEVMNLYLSHMKASRAEEFRSLGLDERIILIRISI